MAPIRLSINIDHVATVRNARGGVHPDPLRAALLAKEAGADGITIHLREDRRHIRDVDVFAIREKCSLPLNLEMAATEEMLEIALKAKPNACCLVPEKREELTTEGGLNLQTGEASLKSIIARLKKAGIKVSLFIEPDIGYVDGASRLGANIVELHTGKYAELALSGGNSEAELTRIRTAASKALTFGLDVQAGHGLSYDNVGPIAAIQEIRELNIGHFLIGEAIFVGLDAAIERMKAAMRESRK